MRARARTWAGAVALCCLFTGCTSLRHYVDNGYKVGPNYARPPALVESDWIDAADARVRKDPDEQRNWWAVFNDPVLNDLVCAASLQNLTVREAAFRVLEARAQLGIALGQMFPQQQVAQGAYSRQGASKKQANRQFIFERFFSDWQFGLAATWELDFWGRFRRAIEASEAVLDASIENYDDVLVTLLGDVATAYVQVRTFQRRIQLLKVNIALQEKTLVIVEARFKGGLKGVTQADVDQAVSLLAQTRAQVPQLEVSLRQTQNRLCVLLGIPPQDLTAKLGAGVAPPDDLLEDLGRKLEQKTAAPEELMRALAKQLDPRKLTAEQLAKRLGQGGIPLAPREVVLGMPAELVRRRPDVRRAEREAAARSAEIGVAEADFYPAISISGQLGYAAKNFSDLFNPDAFFGTVGPSFTWNVLNYGRIGNRVLFNEAAFQRSVARYQQTVLLAFQDVENGVVQFLKGQLAARELAVSVGAASSAVTIALANYPDRVDFNRVSVIQQNLVQQMDLLTQAQGDVVVGLIQTYRALGGGWQIRLDGCNPGTFCAAPEAQKACCPDDYCGKPVPCLPCSPPAGAQCPPGDGCCRKP